MKIRILKNSLRFRLKQPEVEEFEQTGKIMEVLEFGAEAKDQISFALEIWAGHYLSVNFHLNTTTIYVPGSTAEKWTGSDAVGFSGNINTGLGRSIDILVEKDFKCLDAREEENEGSYPNPSEIC